MKKLNKQMIWGIVGTVLVWFPIIWANSDGYFPMSLVNDVFFIYLLTMITAVILIIKSIKHILDFHKKEKQINKLIFAILILIPNIIYIIFGTRFYWWFFAF